MSNPLGDRGKFEPHYTRYADLAKLLITLSGAIIAYLISLLAVDKRSREISQLVPSIPIIVGLFGFAIAMLVIFLLLATWWYEEYCHSIDFRSYTRHKYATVVASGVTGAVLFITGIAWLAKNLFN